MTGDCAPVYNPVRSMVGQPLKLVSISTGDRHPEEVVVGIRDADLVERALGGDVRAEDALFRRHVRYIGGMVARLMGSMQDADDVVHDAFFAAFKELERLEKPAMFRAWVAQIAVNRVRVVLRRRRIEQRLGLFRGDEEATLERLAGNTVSAETCAELACLDEVLHRLPVKQRIVWMLRMVEGHTFDEVAELSGCSLATAKRWFERARRLIDVHVKMGGYRDE